MSGIRLDRICSTRVRVALCLGLCLAGSRASAQIGSGALAGSVIDQAGADVPGATVTGSASATNRTRTAVTNADGGYVVTGLAPGEYRVRVEIAGFRPVGREGGRVGTGGTIRPDLPPAIGVCTH